MDKEQAIDTIHEAIFEHLEYKFKQAGLPMMRFNIHECNDGKNTFNVIPLFMDNSDISVRVRVVEHDNSKNDILMVLSSGSIETTADANQEEKLFSLLSIEIFKKIAQDASRQILSQRGKNCYRDQLKKLDTGEMININYVTYVDFENLDLEGVDFGHIYVTN